MKETIKGKGIYYIEGGKIRPSKSLQDALKVIIDGNEEFIMIDDQKVAFESIRRTVRDCIKNEKKKTIIVEGGPWTGKSVLAINILVKICNMNLNC
jgi:DNA replication protein DnaC